MATFAIVLGCAHVVHGWHSQNAGPSVSHSPKRVHAHKFCIGGDVSLDGCHAAWATLSRAPITPHSDEIAIAERLVIGPGDVIHGLCDCPGVPVLQYYSGSLGWVSLNCTLPQNIVCLLGWRSKHPYHCTPQARKSVFGYLGWESLNCTMPKKLCGS